MDALLKSCSVVGSLDLVSTPSSDSDNNQETEPTTETKKETDTETDTEIDTETDTNTETNTEADAEDLNPVIMIIIPLVLTLVIIAVIVCVVMIYRRKKIKAGMLNAFRLIDLQTLNNQPKHQLGWCLHIYLKDANIYRCA